MSEDRRNEIEPLWTDEEVAAYLQVSVITVQKWAKNGRIPVVKAGSLNRFRRSEIETWVESHREQVVTDAPAEKSA